MNKKEKTQIAYWLSRENTGLSSMAILYTYLFGNTDWIKGTPNYPHDNSDFNRCYLLVKDCPSTFKAIKKLAKKSSQWKNIFKFWNELVFIFENGKDIKTSRNEDFYCFLNAINNTKYGNTNYQKQYDDRRKKGIEIYKKYGFKGKILPKSPISN